MSYVLKSNSSGGKILIGVQFSHGLHTSLGAGVPESTREHPQRRIPDPGEGHMDSCPRPPPKKKRCEVILSSFRFQLF